MEKVSQKQGIKGSERKILKMTIVSENLSNFVSIDRAPIMLQFKR